METFMYLENLSLSTGVSNLAAGRATLGLERLEVYTGNIAAAWLQGFSQNELRSLVAGDAINTIVECTRFITANLPKNVDPRFDKAWTSFSGLVKAVQAKGRFAGDITASILALFLSSIILRTAFNATQNNLIMEETYVTVDSKRINQRLFDLAKAEALKLNLQIDPSRIVALEIATLPESLNLISLALEKAS